MLILPVVLGFVYDWNLFPFYQEISMSVFALMSIIHFILQLFLCYFNWRKITNIDIENNNLTTAIQITGWKEDKQLFKRCLLSIKNQTHTNIKYITFCSDGNEENDQYMVDCFMDTFEDGYVLHLDKVFKECSDKHITNIARKLIDKKHICITQPHRGKRYAMYTQMILLMKMGVDAILLIDSDTIIEKSSLNVLSSTMLHFNADSVTGNVKIYNPENLLGMLISLKYWYAFNIERGAQSFFGNVSCIAGPFGLYKTSMLSKIIDEWINQKFFNKECTFGDDRHLTNLILKNAGKTYYDWRAICYTDTPLKLRRFISQQTRWGKSFMREYIINYQWFHNTNIWLFYDLSFMMIYSIILIIYLFEILLRFDLYYNMLFIAIVIGMANVRIAYAIIMTCNWYHIIFGLYSYIYLTMLIPVKLWSFFTVNITKWGTGSRLIKNNKNIDMIPIVIWNGVIITFLIISFVREFDKDRIRGFLLFGINVVYTFGLIVYYFCISKKYQIKVLTNLTQLLDDKINISIN